MDAHKKNLMGNSVQATLRTGTGFVPLLEAETGQCTYGGRQRWFPKKGQRLRGCGPVAAANILCHLAGSGERCRPLYPGALTQAQFLELMEETYRALSPALVGGVFSLGRFARGVEALAWSRGVVLTVHLLRVRSHSREEALGMVREGLARGCPVAALNLKLRYRVPPGGENFGWHWVTVTGLETGPDGTVWMEVSSWGRRYLLDWEAYWEACRKSLLPSGFVWFS